MSYSMNMSQEKAPKRKKLLPEGWHDFTITNCREETSKKGNLMFVFTMRHDATGYEDDVYAVATEGKRWFLKMILAACDCASSADGTYEWDIPDVLNKRVHGLVEHEDNEYINREGETVKGKQHRITEVKKYMEPDNAWPEEQQ